MITACRLAGVESSGEDDEEDTGCLERGGSEHLKGIEGDVGFVLVFVFVRDE